MDDTKAICCDSARILPTSLYRGYSNEVEQNVVIALKPTVCLFVKRPLYFWGRPEMFFGKLCTFFFAFVYTDKNEIPGRKPIIHRATIIYIYFIKK